MVRKMSFLSDQEGIMNRYLRERTNWDPHLENSKSFIQGLRKDTGIKSLTVLGSGWWLDLPLEELAEKYETVLLVDVFHPPQIVKKSGKYRNLILYETDLTGGGIQFCWDQGRKRYGSAGDPILKGFVPVTPNLPVTTDAFISLNLLSQLDTLLIEFIEGKNTGITGTELQGFRETIQRFHLDWICRKPGCLITDTEELYTSKDGQESSRRVVHAKLPEGNRQENWTWDFDLSGRYREGVQTRMKVEAIEWW